MKLIRLEGKDIHEGLLNLKVEIIKIKNIKDFCRDIKSIYIYEKSKTLEKVDNINFQKDYPEIFNK